MKRSDIGIIILAISGVIILSTTALVVYLNIPIKNATASTQVSGIAKNVSEVEIINQVSIGDINFQVMNNPSSNIIELDWNIRYTGFYLPLQCIIVKYAIESTKITISINTLKDVNIESLNLIISINPLYIYSFLSNSKIGNINFDIYNVNIRNFYINSSSGELDIKLEHCNIYENFEISSETGRIETRLDHLVFFNDFVSKTDSGVQLHDIWNIKFNSIADINITSKIGYIQFYWANHFNKSNIVNINVYSDVDFKVKIWCPLEIMRGQVSLFTTNGTKVFSKPTGTFEEIHEDYYETRKINDTSLDLYNITATSNSGEAWVYYVDCFKWSRDCDYTQDFFPYNVKLIGNYSISKDQYNINFIDFLNDEYIYLNETRSLPITYDLLPVYSEKMLFIDWDINYIHAMGIGVGDLNLKIIKSITDDRLEIHLQLDFVLDRILPTFNECNITVYYHPDYVFTHN